jgi:hypothetical protein
LNVPEKANGENRSPCLHDPHRQRVAWEAASRWAVRPRTVARCGCELRRDDWDGNDHRIGSRRAPPWVIAPQTSLALKGRNKLAIMSRYRSCRAPSGRRNLGGLVTQGRVSRRAGALLGSYRHSHLIQIKDPPIQHGRNNRRPLWSLEASIVGNATGRLTPLRDCAEQLAPAVAMPGGFAAPL